MLDISKIPSATGVYLFKHDENILYIGKSISLKARITSHFENAKLDPKESAIVNGSNKIEYILTDSEFKALLLESSLIQRYSPKYNRRWQDDKSYLYIKITISEEFPKVFAVRKENDNESAYFGPFPSQRDVSDILKAIRRIFPYCSQKKISRSSCFYSKINLCNPCPNEIFNTKDINMKNRLKRIYKKNIRNIINVLSGKTDLILKDSYRLLNELSKKQKFEEALKIRNKIIKFENLIYQKQFTSDITVNYDLTGKAVSDLLERLRGYFSFNELHRIECFDISNLDQKDSTASMVVFKDGYPDKSQYRRFRIKKNNSRSDFDMLDEVLRRRLKQKWEKPDLVVIDGGTPQISRVKSVFRELRVKIPIIGIAKNPDRIVLGTEKILTVKPSLNNLGFNLLRSIRDESHRFAKKYHLLLRRNKIFS